MPIEIRELVVRARIDPGGERPASAGAGAGASAEARDREQEIVRACVREVLRIVAEKEER